MTSTHTKTHGYKRHEDDHWIDEIRVTTVPRWKTSGLSGDEWRFSYRAELMRKGRVYAHRHVGFMDYAALQGAVGLRLSGELKEAGWDVDASLEQDFSQCFNPGCAKPATVEYRLKKEYCRDGHEQSDHRAENRPHRRFCDEHKRRGDCGLEDSDANYEPVELTALEPKFDINRALEDFADSLSTPQGTNERLAYALEEAGITDLVKRARDGEFSDFSSPHAMPKMVLHDLLNKIGSDEAKAIDERMILGEFDG